MSSTEQNRLPERYYLEHFEYLLDFVERKYSHVLNQAENDFLSTFRSLSLPGRCLTARLANRRRSVFLRESFSYQEIGDIDQAIEELHARGILGPLDNPRREQRSQALSLMPVRSLRKAAEARGLSPGRRAKAEVIKLMLDYLPWEQLSLMFGPWDAYVSLRCAPEVEFFYFLFFGNLHADLSEFVLRDLQRLKVHQFAEADLLPRYPSRVQAEIHLSVCRWYRHFEECIGVEEPASLPAWLSSLDISQLQEEPNALRLYHRLVLKVGAQLEQSRLPEEALEVYRRTDRPPSRERRVRILRKLGKTDAANELIAAMIREPLNADERFFALDQERKRIRKRTPRLTSKLLSKAELLELPGRYKGRPEEGAMRHYSRKGYTAYFTENNLWQSMFGLIFWPLIFTSEAGGFHNPLQRGPSDLRTSEYFKGKKEDISRRLSLFSNQHKLYDYLEQTYYDNYGRANPLVKWEPYTLRLLAAVYESVGAEALIAVLYEMAENPQDNLRGFPDLFIVRPEDYAFIEVKGPGDELSAQQLHWLLFFREVGISSAVVRVNWKASRRSQTS